MRDAETITHTHGMASATPSRRPHEETARLGKEIYERDIRRQVEADHQGEVVAIDVDSGSWATGEEVLEAVDLLRAQHAGAINILSERVGYRALVSFGGSSLRRAE